MLRGALVTALVACAVARGDAAATGDPSRAEGSLPIAPTSDGVGTTDESRRDGFRALLARSATPDRDNGSCDVNAPSRFADASQRAPLWGGAGDGQQTHPSVVSFMTAQGWRDPQLVVPKPGGGAPPLDDWIVAAHDMLATTQFLVTTPTIRNDVADDLRRYVFELARHHKDYHDETGCVGNLANCKERFDMPLRMSKEVIAAMNAYVETMRPVIERELGPDAELCELSALMTCAGSPDQSVHSDGFGRVKGDRLLSSFTVLQDTTSRHGPTEVFFPSAVTDAHAKSAGAALVKAAAGEFGGEYKDAIPAEMKRLVARLRKGGVETHDPDGKDPFVELHELLVRKYVYRSKKTNMLYFRTPWEPADSTEEIDSSSSSSKLRGGDGSSSKPKGRRYNIGVTASLRQGSTLVYDSRALHRGSANKAGSRILFLMSFQNKGAVVMGPTYTMDPRYQSLETVEGHASEDPLAGGDADDDDDWDVEDDDARRPEGIDGDLADLREKYGVDGNKVARAELRRRQSPKVLAARTKARTTNVFKRVRGKITLADFPLTEPDVESGDFTWVDDLREAVSDSQDEKAETEIGEKVRRAGMEWDEYKAWNEAVNEALKDGDVNAAMNAWPGGGGDAYGQTGDQKERWDDDLGFVPAAGNDHRGPIGHDVDDGPGSYRHQHAKYVVGESTGSRLVDV